MKQSPQASTSTSQNVSCGGPTPPPTSVCYSYPPQIKKDYSHGTTLLQKPIGSERFIREYFAKQVSSTESVLQAMTTLKNAHVSFHLLRTCLSACKVRFQPQVLPPTLKAPGARLFDAQMEICLRNIMGGVLDSHTFNELQLPMRPVLPSKPNFGLGLTSALTVAAPSFLGSLSGCRRLLSSILSNSRLSILHSNNNAHLEFQNWASTLPAEDTPNWDDMTSEKGLSIQHLSRLAHRAKERAIQHNDPRTASFCASLGLPGSKQWALSTPSPVIRTYIPHRDFTTWLQYYCRVPLYPPGSTCPRQ